MKGSYRRYRLFVPRNPPLSPADMTWVGGELVPNSVQRITITAAAMTWTGAALSPNATTQVAVTPASMAWTGGELSPSISAVLGYGPRWRMRVATWPSGAKYFSTTPLDDGTPYYEGRIMGQVTVGRRLTDLVYRTLEPQAVTVSLSNTDAALTAGYLAGLGGLAVEIERYDLRGYVNLRFSGVITNAKLMREKLDLDISDLRMDVLQTTVPALPVSTALFPKAIDVGKVVPVPFGQVAKMRIPYVYFDRQVSMPSVSTPYGIVAAGRFDYIIGRGVIALAGISRDFPSSGSTISFDALATTEFRRASDEGQATSWAQVARTDIYPGYTAVRVIREELNYQGGQHTLYADVTTSPGYCGGDVCPVGRERNFARAIRTVLSNTVWGLSQTVDAGTFNQAEADLDNIGGLYCDGVIDTAVAAIDVLKQLCFVRGMILRYNSSGAWTLTVDKPSTRPVLTAGDGLGDGPRGFIPSGPRALPSTTERIKTLKLTYRRDLNTGTYLFPQQRSVFSIGRDLPIACQFITDHTTADKAADFVGKRVYYGSEAVPGALTQAYRGVSESDLIDLTVSDLGYSATRLEVREFADRLDKVDVILQGQNSLTYTYQAGTIPSDNVTGTITDLSKTRPAAASGLTVIAHSLERAIDGHDDAYVTIQWIVPATNFSYAVPKFRKSGTTDWTTLGPVPAGSTVTQTQKFVGLITNQAYDFAVTTYNAAALSSATDATLFNFTTDRSTTAPAAPSTITLRQSGTKTVEIVVTVVTDATWGTTEVYRASTAAFTDQVLIDPGKKKIFHDQSVSYNTTYWYRARQVDINGTASAYSGGQFITVKQLDGGGAGQPGGPDVQPGTITTTAIATNAVSEPHIAVAPGGFATFSKSGADVPGVSIALVTGGEALDIAVNTVLCAQNLSGSTSPAVGAVLAILRDGSEIDRVEINVAQDNKSGFGVEAPAAMSGIDTPPPGGHVYSLRLYVHPTAGVSTLATVGAGSGQGSSVAIILEVTRRFR